MDKVFNVWGGSSKNNPNNSYLVEFDCFNMPMGKYKFIITDKSNYNSEFNEVITSIGINPNYDLK